MTLTASLGRGRLRLALSGATALAAFAVAAIASACTVSFGAKDPPARCGDGVRQGEEVCDGTDLADASCKDFGEEGVLACRADCSLDRTGCSSLCGNGARDGSEACDGTDLGGASCQSLGYYTGTLACAGTCELDTSGCEDYCGDLVVNGPEACDGSELGGASCQSLGYYAGTLGCSLACELDTEGCLGRCGDDLINGPEVCDGVALGGRICSDSGYAGGPLGCLPDCSALDFAGCWTSPRVAVNEIFPGIPDWVELRNLSEVPVALEGWRAQWWGIQDNGSASTGTLTLPIYTLGPGQRVVLKESGTVSGDPPIVSAGLILFHSNILWGSGGGAVAIANAATDPIDYVAFCNPLQAPALPAGHSWQDSPAPLVSPGITETTKGLARVPEGADTDSAGDFCVAEATHGEANTSPCITPLPDGTLLITEVQPGSPAGVELYNPGPTPQDLAGWRLKADATLTRRLPSFLLAAGTYVVATTDAPDPEAPFVDGLGLHIGSLGLSGTTDTVALLEPMAHSAVDFLRWGLWNQSVPPPPTHWSDTPARLPAVAAGETLARGTLIDTDTAGDFCIQLPSLGLPNDPCP